MNQPLEVTSPAFEANQFIPAKYTSEGGNVNPELAISRIPSGTKTIAIIMDDSDAENGRFDHWVIFNIPVMQLIDENTMMGTHGLNSEKQAKYTGPYLPAEVHHYHFKVYALDLKLDLPEKTSRASLEKAMEGHILSSGELVGLYQRQETVSK